MTTSNASSMFDAKLAKGDVLGAIEIALLGCDDAKRVAQDAYAALDAHSEEMAAIVRRADKIAAEALGEDDDTLGGLFASFDKFVAERPYLQDGINPQSRYGKLAAKQQKWCDEVGEFSDRLGGLQARMDAAKAKFL